MNPTPDMIPPGGARRADFALAADHNGVILKRQMIDWLTGRGYGVHDHGVERDDEVADYPPLCAAVGRAVVTGAARFGLVIGGTGSGETIACNKIRGVRATLCVSRLVTEIARAHNDANVMVLGAKMTDSHEARELLELWLATPFKGGRHQDRVEQISRLELGEEPGS